jgi:enterochelin esterase-like enzyme
VARLLLPAIACVAAAACSPPVNPIIQGNHATILIESSPGIVPSVTGDFTAWKPVPASQMGGSDWYQFDTRLEDDARVEYMLVFGPRDVRLDPRNPRRVPSVGGEASEIVMPRAEAQPETDIASLPAAGVFEQHEFEVGGGKRTAAVYQPIAGDGVLPVVYFHDGTLMIERGVPQILDRLVQSGRLRPIAAVFVDPVSRADDYKANPEFREWFVNVLLPRIERPTLSQPRTRAVVGVSRGAAAALDLAWNHPDLFSRCGLLIPSTSPTDLATQIARAPPRPIRFSIVAARYDVQWLAEAQALREVLDSRDYALSYREVPEGHNVQTWRTHLDDVLIGLGFGLPAS